jgi:hypothetical protein
LLYVRELREYDLPQLEGLGKRQVNDPQAQPAENEGTYLAGAGLVVSRLPDEVGVAVRRDQFDILCEGGIGEARASRDLCLGIFFGAVIGIGGVLATTEWDNVWKPEHRGSFILWGVILLIMVSGSGVGAIIYGVRLWRTRGNSAYSRLVERLKKLYEAQQNG